MNYFKELLDTRLSTVKSSTSNKPPKEVKTEPDIKNEDDFDTALSINGFGNANMISEYLTRNNKK